MATAAGIIITAGAITLVNEMLLAPYSPGNTNVLKAVNWKVIPATAVAAVIFAGIEDVNGVAGRGLAVLALASTLLISTSKRSSPVQTIAVVMGYGGSSQATVNGTTYSISG